MAQQRQGEEQGGEPAVAAGPQGVDEDAEEQHRECEGEAERDSPASVEAIVPPWMFHGDVDGRVLGREVERNGTVAAEHQGGNPPVEGKAAKAHATTAGRRCRAR